MRLPDSLPGGPLSWLVPDLTRYEPRPPGAHTLRELSGLPPGTPRWPDGPRWFALAGLVREWTGHRVRPQCLPRPGAHGLEAVLARAADHIEDGPFVHLAPDGALTPLERAGNAPGWNLLPLRPDRVEHDGPRARAAVSTILPKASPVVPYFVTDLTPAAKPTTRLHPSWWGLLPGDHYPESARDLIHELWRRVQPSAYPMFTALENQALAGFDAYVDALRGRGDWPAIGARQAGARIIGVCGIDGSGKSSHVAALREHLAGRGLRVTVHKIYRHGVFHETVTDLTRQCRDDRNLHLWRTQRIVKTFDSVKYFHSRLHDDLQSHDVVLFDRYVYTHFAAGMGRYHGDPFTRELLAPFPPADLLFWMDVPVEASIARLAERSELTVDENPYMLRRYAHAFADQCGRRGFRRLDSRQPFDLNQQLIRTEVDRLLEPPR